MHTGRLSLNPRLHAPLFIGSGMGAVYCALQPETLPIIFALAGVAMGAASGWKLAKGLRAALADPATTGQGELPGERRANSLFLGGLFGIVLGAFMRSPEPLWAIGAGVGALVWARELLSLPAMAAWAKEEFQTPQEEAAQIETRQDDKQEGNQP